jgi:hypothetical protein
VTKMKKNISSAMAAIDAAENWKILPGRSVV